MYLELGENMALRDFALQKILLMLSHLQKMYQTLMEVNVVLNLKVGRQ